MINPFFLILICSILNIHRVFAGGYIAFENEKTSVSEDAAPFYFIFFLLFMVYYILKLKNNKFVNDNEPIILIGLFIIIPILIGIILIFIK